MAPLLPHPLPSPPREGSAGQTRSDDGLSIGTVARATGIPAETLRTWELRYGYPAPRRSPAGRRVYAPSVVPVLERMAAAIRRGHRAARVVRATEAELEALLADRPETTDGAARGVQPSRDRGEAGPRDPLAAVALLDARALRRMLRDDWRRLGTLDFLELSLAPALRSVGKGRRAGRFEIRHERLLRECAGDLLRALRTGLEEHTSGPPIVLATLPGDRDDLDLHMLALVVASAGGQPLVLGVEVPPREVARAAAESRADAVAIGVSETGDRPTLELARLRRLLPRTARLLAGGDGAAGVGGSSVEALGVRELDVRIREWRRSGASA